MDVKKYFEVVKEYLHDLSDEEFDTVLIESGIEECPFEDFKRVYGRESYQSLIKPTDSFSICQLKGLNKFTLEGDAA